MNKPCKHKTRDLPNNEPPRLSLSSEKTRDTMSNTVKADRLEANARNRYGGARRGRTRIAVAM